MNTLQLQQAHSLLTNVAALLRDDQLRSSEQYGGVEYALRIANRLVRQVTAAFDDVLKYPWVGTLEEASGLLATMENSLWEGDAEFSVDRSVVRDVVEMVESMLASVLAEAQGSAPEMSSLESLRPESSDVPAAATAARADIFPEEFALELIDDALGENYRVGGTMNFSRSDLPEPGDPVLVEDRDGNRYIRKYEADSGTAWRATGKFGYMPLESERDGLRVLAVGFGYCKPRVKQPALVASTAEPAALYRASYSLGGDPIEVTASTESEWREALIENASYEIAELLGVTQRFDVKGIDTKALVRREVRMSVLNSIVLSLTIGDSVDLDALADTVYGVANWSKTEVASIENATSAAPASNPPIGTRTAGLQAFGEMAHAVSDAVDAIHDVSVCKLHHDAGARVLADHLGRALNTGDDAFTQGFLLGLAKLIACERAGFTLDSDWVPAEDPELLDDPAADSETTADADLPLADPTPTPDFARAAPHWEATAKLLAARGSAAPDDDADDADDDDWDIAGEAISEAEGVLALLEFKGEPTFVMAAGARERVASSVELGDLLTSETPLPDLDRLAASLRSSIEVVEALAYSEGGVCNTVQALFGALRLLKTARNAVDRRRAVATKAAASDAAEARSSAIDRKREREAVPA